MEGRSQKVGCYCAACTEVGRALFTTPELSDSGNHLLLRAGKASVSAEVWLHPVLGASHKENLGHRRSHTDVWS